MSFFRIPVIFILTLFTCLSLAADPASSPQTETAKIHADFLRWVGSLPPEEQKWQNTLEQNLGEANRLIYERQKMEGRQTEYDFVVDNPRLPRLLLIGDSISCGYTRPTRQALTDKFNVHRAPENCGTTANGMQKLDIWLGDQKWDIIHFNFGIHDRSTPLTEYEARLEQIAVRLKATGAKVIWASTTPIPPDTGEGPTASQAVEERNAIAARMMEKQAIPTDDLFAFVVQHAEQTRNPQDVHYREEGYQLLAGQVARSVETAFHSK